MNLTTCLAEVLVHDLQREEQKVYAVYRNVSLSTDKRRALLAFDHFEGECETERGLPCTFTIEGDIGELMCKW